MSKRYLVQFDFGLRDAFGESVEILTEEDLQTLKDFSVSGRNVYLGEIEGKHSEVCGPVGRGDYTIISEDEEDIKVFERLFGSYYGAYHMMGTIKDTIQNQ